MKWTSEFPTLKNVGEWYYVKQFGKGFEFPHIEFLEVRKDDHSDKLYLCKPCDQGIQAMSYGTMLRLYDKDMTTFCGPIPLPPGFAEARKQYYGSTRHKILRNL